MLKGDVAVEFKIKTNLKETLAIAAPFHCRFFFDMQSLGLVSISTLSSLDKVSAIVLLTTATVVVTAGSGIKKFLTSLFVSLRLCSLFCHRFKQIVLTEN